VSVLLTGLIGSAIGASLAKLPGELIAHAKPEASA
jgi:hypothetical protein